MALDFSALKKQRGSFDSLMKEVEKIATPQSTETQKDDRLWSLEVDKAGNGYAIIRFLPPTKGEDLPWVRVWNHGFQGPTGKWYIENSLTTLGKPDPVSELNTELWNSGTEANKEIARKQKRRLSYMANVLIVKDPAHPENDEELERIWNKQHSLSEFLDPKHIKPYDELKAKLQQVLSATGTAPSRIDTVDLGEDIPRQAFKSKPEVPETKVERVKPKAVDLDDEDESLSYFAKLANDN